MSWADKPQKTKPEYKFRIVKPEQFNITDKDDAAAVIVDLARSAGVDMDSYLLPQDKRTYRLKTAKDDFKGVEVDDSAPEEKRPQEDKEPPVYVSEKEVKDMEAKAAESNLYKALCGLFDETDVAEAFRRYRVGGLSLNGESCSVFPLQNAAGLFVDCKIMPYKPNGHRVQETKYPVSWYLTMKGKGGSKGTPMFGEHLLSIAENKEKPAAIVESEKTAVICSIVAPQCLWLAVGSETNLNPTKIAAAKGRRILLFPDVDGIKVWGDEKHAKALTDAGFDFVLCSDYIAKWAKGPKEDIADIIARCREAERNGQQE